MGGGGQQFLVISSCHASLPDTDIAFILNTEINVAYWIQSIMSNTEPKVGYRTQSWTQNLIFDTEPNI